MGDKTHAAVAEHIRSGEVLPDLFRVMQGLTPAALLADYQAAMRRRERQLVEPRRLRRVAWADYRCRLAAIVCRGRPTG